jgi:hypothetical protein
MVDEPDNCCVALRVRIAAPHVDGSLAVTEDLPWVASGPAHPTLLELLGECFGETPREILGFELEHIGSIDPRCPLRLERVVDLGQEKVFVEALILPFGEREAAELGELMRGAPNATVRRRAGWEYAERLCARWEQSAPGGRVPCRYLDVDFPWISDGAASADAWPGETRPACRAPLPANL